MAYDANKPKNRKNGDPEGNPYESMLGGGSSGSIASPPRATTMSPDYAASQAPASPEMMNAGGPTATGHVNFDQLYNANAGVAQRESAQRANAAEAAGQKAVAGRTGAQQGFQQAQRTGATQGPTASDYAYATGQRGFYAAPGEAQAGAAAQQFAAQRQPDAASMMPDLTEEQFKGRLATQAKNPYSGPDALSAVGGYEDLLKQTIAAQDLAKNPTVGLNQTDAALLGAAGRPRFAELEKKYGGLKNELDAANTASIGQAKDARAASKAAQSDYDRLLSDYEAKKAAEAEANKGPEAIRIGAAPGVGDNSPMLGLSPEAQAAWDALPPEKRIKQLGADLSYEDVNSAFDRTLDGVLTGTYGVSGDDAAAIRGDLTPAEWAEYQQAAATSPAAVEAWIRKMLAKVRGG